MEARELKQKKILITSALPYVNNVPHLGNIIGCVLSADVFARYCRSRGKETLFICGTDEYGTATETKALEEGITPKELCDKYYSIHKQIYEWFGISTDIFGRTTTPLHTEITHEIFLALHKNGYVIEDEIVQAYDESAQMFLADRYIEGTCPHCGYNGARADQCDKCGKLLNFDELINPVSKVSKTTPVKRNSRHLFIDLPGMERELEAWIDKASKEGSWSDNSYRIAKGWLAEGLKKRCITRDLKWGVPVPLAGWENKVFYVWFDAPIGYISITANLTKDWRNWWQNPQGVALYQFMGKDNVPFHTVIFPSTLMGAHTGSETKWTLLHHISTTEFLNYEGGKFSKSKGLGVFGSDAVESGIPADVWRYYLLTNRPEKMDTNFTWQDFGEKLNNELLANIGNLVNRTLVFTEREFSGKVPQATLSSQDHEFLVSQNVKFAQAGELLEKVQIKEALHVIMQSGKEANAYFQKNEPWKTAKSDREKCAASIFVLLNQVKDFAIALEPFVPHTSAAIFKQLNLAPKKWGDLGNLSLPAGHALGKPEILFKKIEAAQLVEFAGKYGGTQAERDEKSAKSAAANKGEDKSALTYSISKEVANLGIDVRMAAFSNAKITNKDGALENYKKEAGTSLSDADLNSPILAEYSRLQRKAGVENPLPPAQWLIETVKSNGRLPNINTVVDSYNAVSAQTFLSMGAHDLSKLKGSIRFELTKGNEHYVPLGSLAPEKVNAGEYAAMDDEKIICRMDIKQCEETKITKETKEFIVYAQGNKNTPPELLDTALRKVCENITKFCGGSFRIIKPSGAGKEKPKQAAKEQKPKSAPAPVTPISETEIDFEVGKIIEIARHPNAEKLYVEKIQLGNGEVRQVVSGLVPFFTETELLGKTILLVKNLKPAMLRGTESKGMLLAAENAEGKLEVVSPVAEPGAKATIDGAPGSPASEITIDQFFTVKLEVKGGILLANGKPVFVAGKQVKTGKVLDGKVR